ncbi:MAG: bifunctional 5,10-methylenetetrahydrofolate dehydrogenase/5,10-methenyltetrahydrofolate cyclohydrolase [Phycisphaerales bacterium]|jgi:methylenetetrahydrofolate dehydrogenase (NADP+)/methenyltetrahydrofolate cyclohydrolase|nr:bifunctional 5,10-methylenetetrahydrofolate dehydrogenase/5,10-methenyltetrahydrofolate cyclohydrolase [Phycisphaerales bacterium]
MPEHTGARQAEIIDGRAIAAAARERIAARVREIESSGRRVRLDAVLCDAGDNAARVYADNQKRTCEGLGIAYRLHVLPEGSGYDDIAGRVLVLNNDDACSAIMVHMPLPAGVDPYRVQRLIAPEKDVEGVNPANIGNIVYGRSSLAPCTALAVVSMIRGTGIDLRGKRCVVVGAGDVVGKPIAVLLMRHEATVVSCNKFTWGIEDLCRSADVLVAAAGVPGLVRAEMVKPGAIVIDVGVNRVEGADGRVHTVGDVDFASVSRIAGRISPVPGGVGPVTVAMLLQNVVDAAARAPLHPHGAGSDPSNGTPGGPASG